MLKHIRGWKKFFSKEQRELKTIMKRRSTGHAEFFVLWLTIHFGTRTRRRILNARLETVLWQLTVVDAI